MTQRVGGAVLTWHTAGCRDRAPVRMAHLLLAPDLGEDGELVAAVAVEAERLSG